MLFDMTDRRRGKTKSESDPIFPIRLLKDKIMADGRNVALTPGMAVTAEIKIGRRRVIEYILDPVMRYSEESLREGKIP